MWYRLQEVLYPWYEQIQRDALDSAVLHADETGWRVNGKTHWLWCFTTPRLTYYMIHRSPPDIPPCSSFSSPNSQGFL